MQSLIPQQQTEQIVQSQSKRTISKQTTATSDHNPKQKTQKPKNKSRQRKQKPVKQQPKFELDVKQQTIIVQLVTSIIDKNIQNFKFFILQLRLTQDTTLGLKTILKNYLYTLPHNFSNIMKMIIMLFEYDSTNSVQINQILGIVVMQIKHFYKRQYPHNKEIDQEIISNFKRISYDQMGQFLQFWGNGFIKSNPKIVQEFVDNLLYSDDKDERFSGLKILYSVSEIELPEIEHTIKLIKQSIKYIVITDIDLLLHRYEEHLSLMINQIKTVKSNKAEQLINHMKECKKRGFTINGRKIKPYRTPEEAIIAGLKYNFNNNSFDAFDNKFKHKKEFHVQIAQMLFEESKSKALYFVQKYNLTEHQKLNKNFIKWRSSIHYKQSLEIRNSLEELDAFKPTQNALFPQYEAIQYLSFSHFGLKQSDVIFVSDANQILEQADLTLSKSSIIAFDIESSGGTCRQDKMIIETVQIASETKVYVFDVPKLKGNKSFESLIIKLFCEVNDQIVLGFAYHGNDQKSLRSILSNNKDLKDTKFKTVSDLQKNNPFKKGIGLKDLVEEIFKKTLSKFEQCSGWNNRPLRKCQIHYAALDAYVLIEIFKKMPNQEAQKQVKQQIKQQGQSQVNKQVAHQKEQQVQQST